MSASADVVDRFLVATRPQFSVRTLGLYGYYMRRLARDHNLLTVDGAALAAWLGGSGWERNTMRSARNSMRAFFQWAAAGGVRADDPTVGLPVVPAVKGVAHPVDERLWRECVAQAAPRDRLMLLLAGRCGLRRSEIAQVHTDDIDDRGLVIHGKGGKVRRVPLPDEVRAELKKTTPGWLFPGRWSGHMTPDSVGKAMRRALRFEASGHDCRHRFATRAYEGTRDLYAVQQLMGHASSETTEGYIAVTSAALRAAMDAAA